MIAPTRKEYTDETIPEEHAYPYDDPGAEDIAHRRSELIKRADSEEVKDLLDFEDALAIGSNSNRAAIIGYHLNSIMKTYDLDDLEEQIRACLLWSKLEHFLWWQTYRGLVSGDVGDDGAAKALVDSIDAFQIHARGGKGLRRLQIGALRVGSRVQPVREMLRTCTDELDKALTDVRTILRGTLFDGREFRKDARCDAEAAAIPLHALLKQERNVNPSSATAKGFVFDCVSLFDRSISRTTIENLHKPKSEVTSVLRMNDRAQRLAHYCHILATGLPPTRDSKFA